MGRTSLGTILVAFLVGLAYGALGTVGHRAVLRLSLIHI